MSARTLYDTMKSKQITDVATDLSPQDMLDFCAYHDVHFHAMGTPPGESDASGLGWSAPGIFRVGTNSSPSRGITCSLDEVRKWKDERINLSPEENLAFTALLYAAQRLGGINMELESIVLEQVLRKAYATLDAGCMRHFRTSAGYDAVTSRIDHRYAFGNELDCLITAVRCSENGTFKEVAFDSLLQGILLALPPDSRKDILAGDHVKSIVEAADALDAAPAP